MDGLQRSREQNLYAILDDTAGTYNPSHVLGQIQTAGELVKDFAADEHRRALFSLRGLTELVEWLESTVQFSGRKTLIYVAEGLPLVPGLEMIELVNAKIEEFNSTSSSGRFNEVNVRVFPMRGLHDLRPAVRHTVGRLNRFGATLYTLDARGIYSGSASDPSRTRSILTPGQEMMAFFEGAGILNALAADTGGLSYFNVSNFSGAMRDIERDNRSRYFLTYQPQRGQKQARKATFQTIDVKVRKPGVNVRARKGYID
jgi:VWFA-related protein